MTAIELTENMIFHIRSHNNKLNKQYLRDLSFSELLCEVHPLYKEHYEKLIKKLENED